MSVVPIAIAAFLLPPVTYAFVEANARSIRHQPVRLASSVSPTTNRRRSVNGFRNFRWIVDRSNSNHRTNKDKNDAATTVTRTDQEKSTEHEYRPVTYYTYEQTIDFLAEAIAHDREWKERRRSAPTTTIATATNATTAITATTATATGAVVSALDRPLDGIYSDKPVLRGRFHKWGAILYPPLLGLPLWLKARASPETEAAALLFNLAVETICVCSARLHTVRWKTLGAFQVSRFLDFAAIFFGIALFYSSIGRLLMGSYHPVLWTVIEGIVWAAAIAGTVLKWRTKDQHVPPVFNGIIFLVQGWATLPCVPSLWANASARVTMGLIGGAYFGTLGALAYIFQWPNHHRLRHDGTKRFQRDIVFGPHEMFHVGTLFLFGSFWLSMWFKISELV